MLVLLFYVGNHCYALESSCVVEVVPLVALKPLQPAPDQVAGVFYYRNHLVPVIDLCRLLRGTPSHSYLSTRIILVEQPNLATPSPVWGLMAERVTETLKINDDNVSHASTAVSTTPYLGRIITNDEKMIQFIHLDRLIAQVQRDFQPIHYVASSN